MIDVGAEGIAPPDRNWHWVRATVGRTLRNEAYVGRLFRNWSRTSVHSS